MIPECTAVKPCKVDFYGAKPFAAPFNRAWSGTGGFSFFEWDGGNPERMLDLYAVDRIYQPCPAYARGTPRACLSLPNYARLARGRLGAPRDDMILVKLGADPGMRIETWCTPMANVVETWLVCMQPASVRAAASAGARPVPSLSWSNGRRCPQI